jgi:hypothetical protein
VSHRLRLPAGRGLLQEFIDRLNSNDPPKNAMPDSLWAELKNQLRTERIELVDRPRLFKPDPKSEGVDQGWHKRELADEK